MTSTATTASAKDALQKVNSAPKAVTTLDATKGLLNRDEVKARFNEVLGAKAPAFMSSIVSLVSGSVSFKDVDANSVIASALIAASLDLPINPSLGFAYIIPFNDNKNNIKKAQFQLGYKGFIQLALRSGSYRTINVTEVYEGEFEGFNRFTGELKINEKYQLQGDEKVVGYMAYLELVSGFRKALYMDKAIVDKHAKKFSKSYNNSTSLWKTDFDSMALKTVLKRLISKWGILSVQMQTAQLADQAVITENPETGDLSYEYVDNPENETNKLPIDGPPTEMFK